MQSVEYLESVWQIELGLAESYFALQDIPSALALVEPLLPKLILADHLTGKIQVYQLLSKLAHAKGEADAALEWYIKHDFAKEEQAKSNKAITMAYHQVEFDTKVMEHQISLLEEKNRHMITEGKLEKQEKMLFLLSFVAVLITSILLGLLLIRSMRDKREFKRLSQMDPLTGLYNHKRTYELGVELFNSCRRNEIPFAVAIADIDHFKQVNDTYGHATGDEVLKALTKHMNNHFSGNCVVGRTGGEEFSLFMPGKTREEATTWIGEFQQILRLEAFFGKVIEITMSFGLAVAGPEHKLLNSVIRDADTALYRAKNKGRNRLEVHKDPESTVWEITTDEKNVKFLDYE
jgi:diguanylate cyclase (GGDEF)-like protein